MNDRLFKTVKMKEKRPFVRLAGGLFVLFFWLGVWELLSLAVASSLILPSPVAVVKRLIILLPTLGFWRAVRHSLLRVLLGFLIGSLLGFLAALASHASPVVSGLLSPFLRIVRAIPVASFILIAFFWFDTSFLPVFISAVMVLPIVWQNLLSALETQVSLPLLEMADTYRLGKTKTFFRIVLPSVFPTFASGEVAALGFAWKSSVAAEVICYAKPSVGASLQAAKSLYETETVFAWTLTVCLLSLGMETLLKFLTERRKGGRR